MRLGDCWSREMVERRKRLEEAGDHEAVRCLDFGRFLCGLRLITDEKYSQGKAAERAGISRVTWNRIENGHQMPLASEIPEIADALEVNPSVLFKRAGLPVPPEYNVYDKKRAFRDLEGALDESESLAEFFIYMEDIWQCYQFEQTGKKQRFVIEPNFANALAYVLERLSKVQRLRLAQALVKTPNRHEVKAQGIEYQRFYDSIETLRKEIQSKEEDE
jgi:transcriptional regulator with XRE-family HTH domain